MGRSRDPRPLTSIFTIKASTLTHVASEGPTEAVPFLYPLCWSRCLGGVGCIVSTEAASVIGVYMCVCACVCQAPGHPSLFNDKALQATPQPASQIRVPTTAPMYQSLACNNSARYPFLLLGLSLPLLPSLPLIHSPCLLLSLQLPLFPLLSAELNYN